MKRAFTLVELSIVLVVIGLLVGGVLAGQSLIKASALRSVVTTQVKFTTAINAFSEKYSGLPGDLNTATNYWGLLGGTAAGNDATCSALAASALPTCNGNGDGFITPNTTMEMYRFWQHLANAGLLEGHYRGNGGGSVPGLDAPGTRVSSDDHWDTYYIGPWNIAWGFYVDYGHMMLISGSASYHYNAADLQYIDSKMDDGKPATGKFVAERACTSRAGTSYDAALDPQATYNGADTAMDCFPWWTRVY